jgi:Rieske Fe-S protein
MAETGEFRVYFSGMTAHSNLSYLIDSPGITYYPYLKDKNMFKCLKKYFLNWIFTDVLFRDVNNTDRSSVYLMTAFYKLIFEMRYEMEKKETSRRIFISGTLKTAFAISLWNATKLSESLAQTTHDLTLDLSQAAYNTLKTPGGAVYATVPIVKDKLIVVRLSTTGVAAFSSKCTHEGCQVNLPSAGVAVCPCHNSRFDTLGNVISGPAKTNLTKYNAVLSGNVINIDNYSTGKRFSEEIRLESRPVSIRILGKAIEVNWNNNADSPLGYALFTTSGQQIVPFTTVLEKRFAIPVSFTQHGTVILKLVSSRNQEMFFDIQLF